VSELRAGPGLRWVRAALIAGVALGAGTVAHASAGGLLPRAGVLAGLVVLATIGCAALLGRPASLRRIVLLVAGGQSAWHLLLTAVAGHRGTTAHPVSHAALQQPSPVAPMAPVPRTGSLHDLTVGQAPTPGADAVAPHWVEHIAQDLTGANLLMAMAHLAAAAFIGWWLSTGEQALWSLICLMRQRSADLVRRLLAATSPTPVLNPTRPTTARTPSRERPGDRWQTGRRPARRGPPAPLPAC
jgi:hypothetical protein